MTGLLPWRLVFHSGLLKSSLTWSKCNAAGWEFQYKKFLVCTRDDQWCVQRRVYLARRKWHAGSNRVWQQLLSAAQHRQWLTMLTATRGANGAVKRTKRGAFWFSTAPSTTGASTTCNGVHG